MEIGRQEEEPSELVSEGGKSEVASGLLALMLLLSSISMFSGLRSR